MNQVSKSYPKAIAALEVIAIARSRLADLGILIENAQRAF